MTRKSVMPIISLTVNGALRSVDVRDPDQPLLYALRNGLGLTGPKFGCGLGQCGACTVLLDQTPLRSCITPLSSVAGKSITTIEGLGTPDQPHPVQAAFIAEQAAQCGYCANGMLMTSAALLAANPTPSETEIKDALSANLCRCGTHVRIVRAVMRASGRTPA